MIMRIPILKSILRNLDWFEEARRHHVAPDGSILLGGTNHRLKKDGDWEESKHPRADNGQFGSGSGTSRGGSKKPKPSKTKRKMERRAEAAGQARVGGAIQSLLSGGSALDKVSWFKQPETPAKDPEKPNAKPNATQEKPTEGKPEKPKAEEKPKPADKAEAAKQEIANNIKSGKLKKETVVAAVKTMYEQANAAERRGDSKTARELDLKAEIMTDGAGIKGELYSAGILQMRGKPLMSIGEGMETRSGKPRNYINSLETAHRIENYRNKVVTWGEVLDEFKEDEDNLGLYQYNGKTYLVDYDHPDQFGTMSPDSWRRLKDELTGDDETPVRTSHKPPIQSSPPPKSTHVAEVASSDILQHGKKIDEHGKASLHEYSGGFYMVTQGNPHGMRISKPAWESMKYS